MLLHFAVGGRLVDRSQICFREGRIRNSTSREVWATYVFITPLLPLSGVLNRRRYFFRCSKSFPTSRSTLPDEVSSTSSRPGSDGRTVLRCGSPVPTETLWMFRSVPISPPQPPLREERTLAVPFLALSLSPFLWPLRSL